MNLARQAHNVLNEYPIQHEYGNLFERDRGIELLPNQRISCSLGWAGYLQQCRIYPAGFGISPNIRHARFARYPTGFYILSDICQGMPDIRIQAVAGYPDPRDKMPDFEVDNPARPVIRFRQLF